MTEDESSGVRLNTETPTSPRTPNEAFNLNVYGTRLPPNAKKLSYTAADVPDEKTQWLIEGFLAKKKISILAGEKSKGKTTTTCALAAMTTHGPASSQNDPNGNSFKVLMYSNEDSPSELKNRLIAAGAKIDFVHFPPPTPCDPYQPTDNLVDARRIMNDIRNMGKQVDLIIIDNISQFLHNFPNSAKGIRTALNQLNAIADKYNCAILLVTHVQKDSIKKDPVDRIVGGAAITQVARIIMVAEKLAGYENYGFGIRVISNIFPPGQIRPYRVVKCIIDTAIGPTETTRVEFADEFIEKNDDAPPPAQKKETLVMQCARFITEFLGDRTVASNTVKNEALRRGFSARTFERAREILGLVSAKQKTPDGRWETVISFPKQSEKSESVGLLTDQPCAANDEHFDPDDATPPTPPL